MKNHRKHNYFFRTRVIMSRFLTIAVCLCIGMYTFFMVSSISLINERKEIKESIRSTQITISDLEVRYFELAKSIDQRTIEQLGFTQVSEPIFAYTQLQAPGIASR